MRQVIIDSAKQLKEGLELAKDVKKEGDYKNIVICGMGGSALPADVLNTVVDLPVPLYVHRSYNLPREATENSLLICISYSGNTEETISALEESLNKNLPTIAMSSGGKLEKICIENSVPFVKIPSGIQPRCAIGYFFAALSKVLANSGIISDISAEIKNLSDTLEKESKQLESQGKELAKKLYKKLPIIYAGDKLEAVARIWKIKINENSKVPAFYNYFPELNHNEMVGYTTKEQKNERTEEQITKKFLVVILRDSNDHSRILKRMQLTADLIKKSGAKVEFVEIKDGSMLFKVFSTLLLGDWTSYYLALENEIDPTPVKMVEDFKKLLNE